MKESKNIINIIIIVTITILLIAWLLLSDDNSLQQGNNEQEHSSHNHEDSEQEISKGPHGGRLLINEDIALEITIAESGLPPEFRVYAYQKKSGQAMQALSQQIKLHLILN